jgi:hypothetical protein
MARLQDRRGVRLMERTPALLVSDGHISPAPMVRLPPGGRCRSGCFLISKSEQEPAPFPYFGAIGVRPVHGEG